MTKCLRLLLFPLLLVSCSPSILEGKVVSSKEIREGLTEYLVKTNDEIIPYLKIRTNKPTLHVGSKVSIDASYIKVPHLSLNCCGLTL